MGVVKCYVAYITQNGGDSIGELIGVSRTYEGIHMLLSKRYSDNLYFGENDKDKFLKRFDESRSKSNYNSNDNNKNKYNTDDMLIVGRTDDNEIIEVVEIPFIGTLKSNKAKNKHTRKNNNNNTK
jgi:hypothetical protein